MINVARISDSTSTESSIIAASCTAVKSAMDKANSAAEAASNAQATADSKLSEIIAGIGIAVTEGNIVSNTGVTSINGFTGDVTIENESVSSDIISATATPNIICAYYSSTFTYNSGGTWTAEKYFVLPTGGTWRYIRFSSEKYETSTQGLVLVKTVSGGSQINLYPWSIPCSIIAFRIS